MEIWSAAEATDGSPSSGLLRRVEAPEHLTELQRAEIEELNAIGYAESVWPASDRVGVLIHRTDRAEQGLNLYVSAHAPEATLMDMDGRVLHRWAVDFETTPATATNRALPYWRRVHLLPNGDLLAIHEGLGMIRIDRDSKLLWAFRNRAHHDIFVADDGDIYTLTRRAHIVPRIHPERPIFEDFIYVLTPGGRTKTRISLLVALENSKFAHHLERRRAAGDIFHTNTLEILAGEHVARSAAFGRGNALVSIRELDLLAIVDLESEEVVWARAGDWRRQHQPTLLDTGTMLLFDNQGRDGESRVLELDPLTGEIVWSFSGDGRDLYSELNGSCQRLANGNTLITESDRGRAIEVSPDGEIVWEFVSPHRTGERDQVAVLFEVVRLAESPHRTWLDEVR